MALINCPECNREISDSVKKCPHCGYKLKKNNGKGEKIIVLLLILLVVVGMGTFAGIKWYQAQVNILQDKKVAELGEEVDLLDFVKYDKDKIKEVKVTKDGNFDTKTLGNYKVEYTATNKYGNSKEFTFNIAVKDTVAPKLTVTKKETYFAKGAEFDINKFASGEDKGKVEITYSGDFDINKEGEYNISIIATDDSKNESDPQSMKITVSDRSKADFRNACWGDDMQTVKNYEELDENDSQSETGWLLYNNGKIYGHNAYVGYAFNEKGKLYLGLYSLSDSHTDYNEYITEFNDLKKALTKKYGKPDFYKKNIVEPELYPYANTDGDALNLGYLQYWATWNLDGTTLDLYTDSDNFDISVCVRYKSTKVSDTEDSSGL